MMAGGLTHSIAPMPTFDPRCHHRRGTCILPGADLSAGGATDNASSKGNRPKGLNRDGGGLLTLRIFDSKNPRCREWSGSQHRRLTRDGHPPLAVRFGFVFARRGIIQACSSWFLPRVVGISQALEWTYSGASSPPMKRSRVVSYAAARRMICCRPHAASRPKS
jgi:hypothetical protein